MRQPRFTYPGALHHCMNRGHGGEPIFADKVTRVFFVNLLAEKVQQYRMRLFAYCIMDNHYHLVLQNGSGRMSDFFRHLNTQYAFFYRKEKGGKGYVFQSRYLSTIIENDEYLKLAIAYVLQNPLRAGLAQHYRNHLWSSRILYDNPSRVDWIDINYILELFGGTIGLENAVQGVRQEKLPLKRTRFGLVLGDGDFLKKATGKFERRSRADPIQRKRQDDFGFEAVEKVIWEFERKHGVNWQEIDVKTISGKRLRGELLVRLKDLAGLKYREILELPAFSDLHFHSLGHLYKNAKKRWQ